MPLSPAFSISRTPLNDSLVIATDDSTGSDILVVARRITLTDCNGNTLVVSGTTTSYNLWPLVTNPITLDLLTTDTAVSILVQWVDVSGTALYSSTQSYCLANYGKSFLYYLEQQNSLTPGIVQDSNFSSNLAALWADIRGALNAVEEGNDIAASQNALNRANNLRLNESLYF
jgi:hypothetical protein